MTTGVREPESAKLPEERQPKLQWKADRSLGLERVFAGTQARVSQLAEGLQVSGIACDSRKVAPGFVFFALHGAKEDGNKYVRDAVQRGAIAVASEDAAPADLSPNVAWIRMAESRKTLAVAAANFF